MRSMTPFNAGLYLVADVTPRGGKLMLFVPNDEGPTYRLAKQNSIPGEKAGEVLPLWLTGKRAQYYVDAYHHEEFAKEVAQLGQSATEAEAGLRFVLHLVPFGATVDNAIHGQWKEMTISLVGDAGFLFAGPLAELATANNALRTAKGLRLLGAAAETGVGVTRATQGIFALKAGDNSAALGYIGEATLRLLGVSLQTIKALKTPRPAVGHVPLYSGPACFVPGTPLLTPDGEKAIEQFRPGDLILSRSEYDVDGSVEAKVVEAVFVRVAPVLPLVLGGRTVRTTAEHPFYALGKGWRCAKELQAGDWLVSHESMPVQLEEVGEPDEVTTVYNLRVADYHTYFVGSRKWGYSVWAHNAEYEWFLQGGKYYVRNKATKQFVRKSSGQVLELADRAAVDTWAAGLQAGSTASEASGLISRLHTLDGAELPGGMRIKSLTLVDETIPGISGRPVLAGNSIQGRDVTIRVASNQSNRQVAISIYHETIEVAIAEYGPTGIFRGKILPRILDVDDAGIDALARKYYNNLGVPSVENLSKMFREFGIGK